MFWSIAFPSRPCRPIANPRIPAIEPSTASCGAAFGFVMSRPQAPPTAMKNSEATAPRRTEIVRVWSFMIGRLRLEVGGEGQPDAARYRRRGEADAANECSLRSGVGFRIPSGVVRPCLEIAPGERETRTVFSKTSEEGWRQIVGH